MRVNARGNFVQAREAETIAFLCSAASFVTGVLLAVDGGWTAQRAPAGTVAQAQRGEPPAGSEGRHTPSGRIPAPPRAGRT